MTSETSVRVVRLPRSQLGLIDLSVVPTIDDDALAELERREENGVEPSPELQRAISKQIARACLAMWRLRTNSRS